MSRKLHVVMRFATREERAAAHPYPRTRCTVKLDQIAPHECEVEPEDPERPYTLILSGTEDDEGNFSPRSYDYQDPPSPESFLVLQFGTQAHAEGYLKEYGAGIPHCFVTHEELADAWREARNPQEDHRFVLLLVGRHGDTLFHPTAYAVIDMEQLNPWQGQTQINPQRHTGPDYLRAAGWQNEGDRFTTYPWRDPNNRLSMYTERDAVTVQQARDLLALGKQVLKIFGKDVNAG